MIHGRDVRRARLRVRATLLRLRRAWPRSVHRDALWPTVLAPSVPDRRGTRGRSPRRRPMNHLLRADRARRAMASIGRSRRWRRWSSSTHCVPDARSRRATTRSRVNATASPRPCAVARGDRDRGDDRRRLPARAAIIATNIATNTVAIIAGHAAAGRARRPVRRVGRVAHRRLWGRTRTPRSLAGGCRWPCRRE